MPKLYWVVLGAGSGAVCLRCSGLGPAIVVYYFPPATKGEDQGEHAYEVFLGFTS